MPRNEVEAVNEIANREQALFLERSAKAFCESAIHLLMTCMSVSAVVAFLERQTAILKEYG